jgi:hypothetical protein
LILKIKKFNLPYKIGKLNKANGDINFFPITSDINKNINEIIKRDSINSKKHLTIKDSLKLKEKMPNDFKEELSKDNLETKESTQPTEIIESNVKIINNKYVVSSNDSTNKSKNNEISKGKAAEKIKEKNNINFTKVVKSGKSNSIKGIVDITSMNKILENKKINSDINSKYYLAKINNKVNISGDSSLNKSNITITKSNQRPNSMKGRSNDIVKSKDNNSARPSTISKITGKLSVANKDKILIGSIIYKNKQRVNIPNVNKVLNESNLESSAKNNFLIVENSEKKQKEVSDPINQIPENKENSNLLNDNQIKEFVKTESKEISTKSNIKNLKINDINKNDNANDLILGGIILNKTSKNSFENLSDLKKSFTERNLNSLENNHSKIVELQEINREIKKEDLDNIKFLEDKRKKLYSKLGYDVIDPNDSTSKSSNFRQRKSDLDVFQNVNVKKLAKILEQRYYGLDSEEDIDDKLKVKAQDKAEAKNYDNSDFLRLNSNREKKKPTHKRFSLV